MAPDPDKQERKTGSQHNASRMTFIYDTFKKPREAQEDGTADIYLLSARVVILTGQLLLHLRHLHQLPLRH